GGSTVRARGGHRCPHSFPTRRSSDLAEPASVRGSLRGRRGRGRVDAALQDNADRRDDLGDRERLGDETRGAGLEGAAHQFRILLDRKSTRLNSSHQIISYAVFCLKKK